MCLSLLTISFNLSRHYISDFVKPVSSKGLSIEHILLSDDELGMYIDLLPFLNPSPYIVPEDMSLAKVSVIKFFNSNVEFQIILFSSQLFHLSINQVYNLFRQLGLRHVFVVPRASHTLGLITRKDLLIEVFFMFIYIVNDLLPKINLLCFLY